MAETGADTDTDPDPDVDVVLVAAVAENGVIGREGEMPWHYPADLAQFKETTMGHPVVLGRRTYESIVARLGDPLPGRTSVVLTRSGLDEVPDSVVVAGSVEEALRAARRVADERGVETAYVAGGGAVYEQFLPLADRLQITEVPESPEGDAYFPEFDRDEWVEVERESAGDRDGDGDGDGDGGLTFVTYERQ